MKDPFNITNLLEKSELVKQLRHSAAGNLVEYRQAKRRENKVLSNLCHGYYKAYKASAWMAATGTWKHDKAGLIEPVESQPVNEPATC
jgi:hypothetical protein